MSRLPVVLLALLAALVNEAICADSCVYPLPSSVRRIWDVNRNCYEVTADEDEQIISLSIVPEVCNSNYVLNEDKKCVLVVLKSTMKRQTPSKKKRPLPVGVPTWE